jgi:hypothetical protein
MRSYLKNTQHKAELADGSSGRVQIPVPPKTKKELWEDLKVLRLESISA